MWLAGQVDGDGNIGLYNNQARLKITKADKSLTTLQRIQNELGGAIYSYPTEQQNCQDKSHWIVTGAAALKVVKAILPYSHVKQDQCKALMQVVPGRWQVRVYKEGKEVPFDTKAELAKVMNATRTDLTEAVKRGDIFVKGYKLENVAGQNSRISAELKQLKKEGHATPEDPIHPAYIAGFFDADGYVALTSSWPRVVITQKYSGVLWGFQKQYGGQVKFSRRCHYWTICGQSARAFLCVIRHFVYEKREQVELALRATKDNWRVNEAAMKLLRGNGGPNKREKKLTSP